MSDPQAYQLTGAASWLSYIIAPEELNFRYSRSNVGPRIHIPLKKTFSADLFFYSLTVIRPMKTDNPILNLWLACSSCQASLLPGDQNQVI